MNKNIVTHPGIVKKIEADRIKIAIMVTSGCASCEIKGACSVSDVEEKSVMVHINNPEEYNVGQTVTIEMSQSLGTWAVLLGYVFPFFVLLLGLLTFISFGLEQGLAGVLSLALLIPYYFTIYLLKEYIGTRFKYSIRS